MPTLLDICKELTFKLNSITDCWLSTISDFCQLRNRINNDLKDELARKLSILQSSLISECESLNKQHIGTGYVYLTLNDKDGFVSHWVPDEQDMHIYSSWHKVLQKAMVIPLPEALAIIGEAQDKLQKNDYSIAINFLHRYGQSIV